MSSIERRTQYEIWSLRHPLRRISPAKILRIVLATEAVIGWSTNNWAQTNNSDTIHQDELNLWFADFSATEWPAGSMFAFTIFWKRDQRWEGRDWRVMRYKKQTVTVGKPSLLD
jgi:glucoamylase